ncbi:hypothetical protein J6590_061108 [Homalodisca vitripennis]|nr:hypothetical protein J6590_061108 [Homalodisca vitripennis]
MQGERLHHGVQRRKEPSSPTQASFLAARENYLVVYCARSRDFSTVQRLSQDNRIKLRRAWLLLGWMTAERSCPCKQPACPAIGGGSEVTFKPLVPRLSVRDSLNFAW